MTYKAVDEEVIRYAIQKMEEDKESLQKALDTIKQRIKDAQVALSLDSDSKLVASIKDFDVFLQEPKGKGEKGEKSWNDVVLQSADSNGIINILALKGQFPEAPANTFHAAIGALRRQGYKITSGGGGAFKLEKKRK